MLYVRAILILASAALLLSSHVYATGITGQANIAGAVSISGTAITFNPDFINTNGAMETGSFSGLTGGSIQSLTGGPATGAVSVPGFISFSSGVASPITFDLTFIAPGVGTLADCSSSAVGASCTPANSPFTLLQLTSNTVVGSLQLNGVAYVGSPATGTTPTVSVFSTTTAFEGTIPQVYQTFLTNGSLNGATFAASFRTASVPEPDSALLVGLTVIVAGLVARWAAARA